MKFAWKVTRLGLLGLLGMAFGTVNPCKAQNYTITDLGTLPGHTWSTASGINARGQIVGTSSPTAPDFRCSGCRPFLWQDGVMTDSAPFPSWGGEANAINASGQTVGSFRAPGFFGVLAASHNNNGCVVPLATTGFAFAINDSGQVAGLACPGVTSFICFPAFNEVGRAFLWSNGVFTTLNPLSGATDSEAHGINAGGEVVGSSVSCKFDACVYRATLWSEGLIRDLGTYGRAWAINDAGRVIGTAGHAFVWSEGVITDLGTLPGDNQSSALAINNSGQIVGSSTRSGGFPPRAVRWSDGAIVNLNDLIPADSGWVLREATGINDRGQIVGQGTTGGQFHAFLLTP